jgi:hypothetical protein
MAKTRFLCSPFGATSELLSAVRRGSIKLLPMLLYSSPMMRITAAWANVVVRARETDKSTADDTDRQKRWELVGSATRLWHDYGWMPTAENTSTSGDLSGAANAASPPYNLEASVVYYLKVE